MGFRWTKEFGAGQDPLNWSRRDGLPVSEKSGAAWWVALFVERAHKGGHG